MEFHHLALQPNLSSTKTISYWTIGMKMWLFVLAFLHSIADSSAPSPLPRLPSPDWHRLDFMNMFNQVFLQLGKTLMKLFKALLLRSAFCFNSWTFWVVSLLLILNPGQTSYCSSTIYRRQKSSPFNNPFKNFEHGQKVPTSDFWLTIESQSALRM